jgi:hypothetical protein
VGDICSGCDVTWDIMVEGSSLQMRENDAASADASFVIHFSSERTVLVGWKMLWLDPE